MYYIILLFSLFAFLVVLTIFKKKPLVEKVLVFIVIGIFALRFSIVENDQICNPKDYTLLGGQLHPALNFLGEMCLWFRCP